MTNHSTVTKISFLVPFSCEHTGTFSLWKFTWSQCSSPTLSTPVEVMNFWTWPRSLDELLMCLLSRTGSYKVREVQVGAGLLEYFAREMVTHSSMFCSLGRIDPTGCKISYYFPNISCSRINNEKSQTWLLSFHQWGTTGQCFFLSLVPRLVLRNLFFCYEGA